MNEFSRLEQFAKLQKPPAVKYKDLEATSIRTVRFNSLPMKVQADFIRVTDSTIFVQHHHPVRSERPAVPAEGQYFQGEREHLRPHLDPFPADHQYLRDVVTWKSPTELLAKALNALHLPEGVPLAPGTYRLNVVAKDIDRREYDQLRNGA